VTKIKASYCRTTAETDTDPRHITLEILDLANQSLPLYDESVIPASLPVPLPLKEQIIKGVLQTRRDTPVILRRDKDKGIVLPHYEGGVVGRRRIICVVF
jgi:hypothetical protein